MHFNYLRIIRDKYYLMIMIIFMSYKSAHNQLIRSVEFSQKANNQFISKPLDSSISLFEMRYSYSNIHIDLGNDQQQVIVIRNEVSVKLKLSLQIYAPSSDVYNVLVNEFCLKRSMSVDALCHKIPTTNANFTMFNMNVVSKWLEDRSGFKLSLEPPSSIKSDLSGFYFFKTTSPISGMVLTNFLEIRDILFWEKNIMISSPAPIKVSYEKSLSSSEIPKVFTCFDQSLPFNLHDIPYWIPLEFKSFVKWAWCPVSRYSTEIMEKDKSYLADCLDDSISKCEKLNFLCPTSSGLLQGWKEIIDFYGSITLIKGTVFNNYGGKLDGYGLMCYYQSRSGYKAMKYIANSYDQYFKTFTKGLQWISTENKRMTITVISSLNQTVKIGLLKKRFVLSAFYNGPANYSYEWFKSDKKIFPSSKWLIGPYNLEYTSKISLEMQGQYSLKIRTDSQIIHFLINVQVMSPPVFVKKSMELLNSTVYLMVDSNFSISFLYKANPKNAIIYINGIAFKPGISDRNVFLNDLAQKAFNLKHLDFDFIQNPLPDGVTNFTYILRKVLFPDTLPRGQDHNLIVEAYNDHGVCRTVLNIYVLKPPKFDNLPQYDNCTTNCLSSQPHLFRCEMNTEYYLIRDVVIEKFWLVDDIRLDSLPYHSLYFKDDTKGLNLMPIKTNNSKYDLALKKLLKNARLICRVRLLYPGSQNMPDAKLIRENRIIYDTFYDPSLISHTSAEIRLDWQSEIATASYSWVIFLAIAILLFFMFIFLLVKFTLRGQGKSYQIEKLEIAKGYDRDEEIIENETIKPYLRSNANYSMNHSDRDSSSNYSPQNGTKGAFKTGDVLDSIDDGESTIDPSKYNEEGSFIGIYATKTNHSRLPAELKQ